MGEEYFKRKLAWSSGGFISETLPRDADISRIGIKHNTGTPGGGSYVANTAIENIKIRVAGKEVIVWDGEKSIAGQVSMGIACLREFYKQMHNGVAMTNEYFIVDLPKTIPKGKDVHLVAEMATLASMGITTSYDGTYDLFYEAKPLKGKPWVPNILWGGWNDGALTGALIHYLTTLPFPLRTLILITMDGTTLADDTYDELLMELPQKPKIFDGEMITLKEEHQRKSGVSLTTGFFMKSFPEGLRVNPDSFKIQLYAATAGTAKKVHWAAICY